MSLRPRHRGGYLHSAVDRGLLVCPDQTDVCNLLPCQHCVELVVPVQGNSDTSLSPTALQCTHFLFPMAPLMCVMCGPQVEFAQHQSRLAKRDTGYEKCTGMKKIDWTDHLKGKLVPCIHYTHGRHHNIFETLEKK